MTEHVLVTGGAGYIGGTAVPFPSATQLPGHRAGQSFRGHRMSVPDGALLIVGDCGNRECLEALFKANRFDAVMHFAAFAEVGESMHEPAKYFRNNTCGTLALLETCLKHGVCKIVFSSTCAVFGFPDSIPITEEAAKRPANPYGQSKLQTEIMLEWFHRIHGLRYAVLRYFNAAGAWDHHGEHHDPESHLIPNVLRAALGAAGPVALFGTDYPTPDGTCVRDFVHIYDLATAHLAVLQALEHSGSHIYNLGNGTGFSVREVIAAATRITGRNVPFVESPRRAGDPPVLVASSEKIRKELGWTPKYTSLEEILRSAWHWHVAHPAGYTAEL